MKLFHVLTIAIFCFTLPFASCTSSADEQTREEARQALPQGNPDAPAATTPASSDISATVTNPAGVPHYQCPDKCAGGVGAGAGNCPVCGKAMAHNQAFHDTPSNTSASTTSPITAPAAPKTPEPAQNAAGVWHYTCSKGCAGGAGAAGTCSSCGAALAHNSAYHN